MNLAYRSFLYVPGNRQDRMRKALAAGADAVIFDLEDAVPPAEKAVARVLVREVLDECAERVHASAIFVRVDAVGDGNGWQEDISACVVPHLSGIRLPKVETAHDVALVAEYLTHVGSPPIGLTCSIETALGVVNANEIAAGPGVELLSFGALDFLRDIDGHGDGEESNTLVAKSLIVLASRAANLPAPVGPVFSDLQDLAGLRASSLELRKLGFSGRSCIHPKQVAIVNEAFSPTNDEVRAAGELLNLAERAERSGIGATATAGGRFIDRPQVERARRILAEASKRNASEPQGVV